MTVTVTVCLAVALAALLLGTALGAVLARLSLVRREQQHLRTEMDLQAERRQTERLQAELQASRDALASLQDNLRETTARLSRTEAESKALADRCGEKTSLTQRQTEEAAALRRELAEKDTLCARLKAEYDALKDKLATQQSELEKLHEHTLSQFRVMAAGIMDEKSKAFKELNSESLKTILEPLNRDIESFRKQVSQCYETETKERSSLQEQIRQLAMQNEAMRREADKLSSALRGGTKVQGDWGEMILLNILRQSGLREGSDFEVQKAVDAPGDNSRPDAVLHFPNHSDMIIDSKVSFTAYDNYMNATNDDDRRRYARQHLESVYNHINELARKDYPARNNRSPEFVIMFIPVESMFMLALDEARAAGKNLWHDAYTRRIIIMTPTNLVLAVRMLQDMWRQQRLEANIRAIKERAEKIYTQFVSFSVDIDAIRSDLGRAVASCDSARRRLIEGPNNLIAQFEKMRHLGLEPKMPAQATVRKSWKLLHDEALGSDLPQASGGEDDDDAVPPSALG